MSGKLALRLGILGGTFDPIHIGHLHAASEVLEPFGLDRVLFVPAGRPWQRTDYSSAEDRYLMATMAVASNPAFAVSRIELDRKGPTYTADTLEELKSFYGAVMLYLIVGSDAALNLGTWKGLERIAALAEVIIVDRPDADADALEPGPGWPRIHRHRTVGIDVSASEVRDRVRADAPIDDSVPAPVADYIRDRGLYVGVPEGSDV